MKNLQLIQKVENCYGVNVTREFCPDTKQFIITINDYKFSTNSWLFSTDLILSFLEARLRLEKKDIQQFFIEWNNQITNNLSEEVKNLIPEIVGSPEAKQYNDTMGKLIKN